MDTTKALFIVIAFLMAAIVDVGIIALAFHPDSVPEAIGTGVETIEEAFIPETIQTPTPTPTPTPKPTQTTIQTPTPTPTPTQTQAPNTFTLAQIAAHSSSSSCYSAINGGVYDLTNWINQHPGGREAIRSICGVDGSEAFNDQHSGERRPANELAGFKIGTLIQ